MTNSPEHNEQFSELYKDDLFTLVFNKDLSMAICTADSQYIPIKEFKRMFSKICEMPEISKIDHFVFDKRSLRTFHQPSMEWYYAIWKPEMKKKGVTNHYKILPNLEWFLKAVEAGKQEIFQKYGSDLIDDIHVEYIDSIDELIKQLEK